MSGYTELWKSGCRLGDTVPAFAARFSQGEPDLGQSRAPQADSSITAPGSAVAPSCLTIIREIFLKVLKLRSWWFLVFFDKN